MNAIVERSKLGFIERRELISLLIQPSFLAPRRQRRSAGETSAIRPPKLMTWINVYLTYLVVMGFHISICSSSRFLVNYRKALRDNYIRSR